MPSFIGLFINSISVNIGRNKLFESTLLCLKVNSKLLSSSAQNRHYKYSPPSVCYQMMVSKRFKHLNKAFHQYRKPQEYKTGDSIALQQLQPLFSCLILRDKKRKGKGGSGKVLLKADIGILQQLRILYGRHHDLH